MDDVLNQVRDFAEKAHGEQKRKFTGEKFIRHPERVAGIVDQYTSDTALLAAALLHDVLEDTTTTSEDLKIFLHRIMHQDLAAKTHRLVVDLTDIYVKSDYPQLNRKKRKQKEAERMKTSLPDAQTIKFADIIDNALDIVKNDKDFARIYLNECRLLLSMMDKGNPNLRQKATHIVLDCLNQLK